MTDPEGLSNNKAPKLTLPLSSISIFSETLTSGADLGFYLIDHRLIALAMVMVLAVACEFGYRAGSRKQATSDSFRSLMNGIGAATLGLLGLLLGLTLSMAIARWDARRDVIVNESNAIGTLWLRGGFLDEPLRGELRDALCEYTDARIALASFSRRS